jgi:hypothetical protein
VGDRDWSGFTGVECVFREDANLRRRLPPKRKPAPAPPPVVQLAPEPTLAAEEPVNPAVELAPEPTAVAEQPAALEAAAPEAAVEPTPPEPGAEGDALAPSESKSAAADLRAPTTAPRRKNGLRWWTDPGD